jgi:plastocyanin
LLTDSSKVFLPVAGVALVAFFVYTAASSDDAGATLLGFLLLAAAAAGATLVRYRENEVAPQVPADAPAAAPRPVRPEPSPPGGGWALLGAAAAGLAVSGFVIGPAAAIAGCVLGTIALVGWFASLSAERTGRMLNLLPIGLPVLGFFVIGTLIFFMSRMLLAVPSANASTVVAIAVAVLVLAAGTLVAAKPTLSSSSLMLAGMIAGTLFLVGGLIAAAFGEREGEHGAFAGPVSITAKNLVFDKDELDFRADAPSILRFRSDDTEAHNVAIYNDDSLSRTIFTFDPIPGPISQDFQFTAPAEGEYYFRCDVHPQTMEGTVVVEPAAAE